MQGVFASISGKEGGLRQFQEGREGRGGETEREINESDFFLNVSGRFEPTIKA